MHNVIIIINLKICQISPQKEAASFVTCNVPTNLYKFKAMSEKSSLKRHIFYSHLPTSTFKLVFSSKFKTKFIRYDIIPDESGSTARNASARILTAQHFFQKCQLLDTKSVNCSTQKVSTAQQTKVCRTCTTFCFWADDKKVKLLKILSSWQNFCDSKK